jgi:hypothetical protein
MKPRTLILTDEERCQLERTRAHDPRPYLRERAGALLKVAQGQSTRQVALHGLLQPRRPDTLYQWLNAFERTRRLPVRPATRRAFSP